ncbi:uncharacterized protein LOC143025498 isoform X2 [Oratosquilla oratoria]|uniref:uncharacterized protein LOC143025498 isoform X2 n=1 Tax=Oratosquilla oratoria TaxID=337810 RepID=UPI003F759732
MLSYMLPVEEKVNFPQVDAPASFTPLSEDRSPVSETKPLLSEDKDSIHSPQELDSPNCEEPPRLTMEEKERSFVEELKPEDAAMEQQDKPKPVESVVETEDGTKAEDEKYQDEAVGVKSEKSPQSEKKTVLSSYIVTPGSEDRPIIKTAITAKPNLKRVSFGSSKGSMVETLIYDSPVAEEERIPEEETQIPYRDPVAQKFGTDSGRDNPFRPDGDISKEADEIVELIKSGRPLSAAAKQQQDEIDAKDDLLPPADTAPPPDQLEPAAEPLISPVKDESTPLEASPISPSSPTSPEKAGANGSAAADGTTTPTPAAPVTPSTVEVTHATVKPSEAAHAEHVVIKKKNKCSCCVIQ